MTPHRPSPLPPPAVYPTAPPWAAPAPAPPRQGLPAHDTVRPYPQHGGLLVRYPEAMVNAARPRPPAWWPVVAWTVLLGVPGAVSAGRRAARARRQRHSPAPYWVAWALALVASGTAYAVAAAAAVPAYLDYQEDVVTKVVQDGLRANAWGGAAATSVTCTPAGPRDGGGLRRYDCLLAAEDGRSGSIVVTADADGTWTAVPRP